MQYQLNLNLQQRAALKAAISFWENKEVKDKVTKLFRSCYELEICEARKKWDELKKAVINEWNRDLLPQEVDIELINIVKMIGDTIFNWYYYIKDQYEARHQAINCIDEIHWTPYGTIDAVKTFKTYWLNNPDLGRIQKYNFACNHMIEDHINDLWNKIPRSMQSHYVNDIQVLESFDGYLLAYWKHHRDGDLTNLSRYFGIAESFVNRKHICELIFMFDSNIPSKEKILRLSAFYGHFSAVKYFWEKLTEEERNESVVRCARMAVSFCSYYYQDHKYIEHYKINEYIEICIYLMNQMTDDHKKALFNEIPNLIVCFSGYNITDVKNEILRMLLSAWPWQELFMPVFEDIIRLLNDNTAMDCKFLDIITEKMSDDYLPGYSTEMSNYRSLFRHVWFKIPRYIKQILTLKRDKMPSFINNLINMWDLDSLQLIFNDPDVADVRNESIHLEENSYKNLRVDDKLKILDQFVRRIFKSEEKIKDYKKSINLFYTFMLNHDYHSADKFLDWVCCTPEEKESKKKMEFEKIFDVLICEHDFKVLDKFLNWTFETEEEKKIHKNRLKNDVRTVDWIFDVWRGCNGDINEAKDECSQFLHWLLESEEEIAILKKELFSAERNQINWYVLGQLKRKGVMEDLFSWCMLPDEEVQRIEQALTQQNRQL